MVRRSHILGLIMLSGCQSIYNAGQPEKLAPESSTAFVKVNTREIKTIQKNNVDLEKLDPSKVYALFDIVHFGLLNNPKTKQSYSKAVQQSALYGQSLKDYFILSQAQSTYQRQKYPQVIEGNNLVFFSTLLQNQLQLSYTIFDFGQTRENALYALYQLYEANFSHNQSLQSTFRTLSDEYYNYIYQEALFASSLSDIDNANLTLKEADEKLSQGMTDIADVLQAKNNYLSYKLKSLKIEKTKQAAMSKLLNSMGAGSMKKLHVKPFPKDTKASFNIKSETTYLTLAKALRPDYLAAKSNVTSSMHAVKLAKSKYYPTLNSSFNIGKTNGNNGLHDDYDFQASVSLTLPLFQGFYLQNNLKKAKAGLQYAEAKLQQVACLIEKEVSDVFVNLRLSRDSLTFASEYLEAAKEDFTVNLKKYKQGTSTIIDLIASQTRISDANAQLIQAKRDYYQSIVDLAFATGSLNAKNETIEELNKALRKGEHSAQSDNSF